MRIIHFIAAIILTYLMLHIARTTSRGHPEQVTSTENGFTFEMTTVPDAPENSMVRLDVKISGQITENLMPVIKFVDNNNAEKGFIPLVLSDSTKGEYFTQFSTGARGGSKNFFIQILDENNAVVASLSQEDGTPFRLRNIGKVPILVLISHIGFMFATVFCVAMGFLHALRSLFGKKPVRTAIGYIFFAALFTLLGGYPFGFAMNWFAYGTIWEGVPFGTDATDNKTQLMLVYFLLVVLAGWRTLRNGKSGRDVFNPTGLGIMTVISFFLMLGIYLIPHSIQFSPGVTYAVSYSFIALCALIYLVGYLTSNRARV